MRLLFCRWCGKEIRRFWCPGGWSPWMHWSYVRVSATCRTEPIGDPRRWRTYVPATERDAEPEFF